MTQQAIDAVTQADLVVGYTTYIRLLEEQFPELRYYATPMRKETDRCRAAVEAALTGKTVRLSPAVTAAFMAWQAYFWKLRRRCRRMWKSLPCRAYGGKCGGGSPGRTADARFAVISLSDCMTPLELIWRRVSLAAEADFVICLYNPKSRSRTEYLAQAAVLIGQHRSPDTPVGIVRNAGRAEEKAWITTLKKLPEEPVDMFCVVLIGNFQTYVQNGKMITPRGYCIHPETQA